MRMFRRSRAREGLTPARRGRRRRCGREVAGGRGGAAGARGAGRGCQVRGGARVPEVARGCEARWRGGAGAQAASGEREEQPREGEGGGAAAAGRRPGAAERRTANGIAAFPSRRTPPRISRAATTRTTCRPACSAALQLTSMFPNLVLENFYRKTHNSIEAGKTDPPYGYVIPVQRDMTRSAKLVNLLRVQRIEVGQATAEIKNGDGTFPAGSYVIKRDQPYGRLAKNLLEQTGLSRSQPAHLRRQRLDDGAGDAARRQGDQGQGDSRGRDDAGEDAPWRRARSPATAGRDGDRALRIDQHDRAPLQAAERRR